MNVRNMICMLSMICMLPITTAINPDLILNEFAGFETGTTCEMGCSSPDCEFEFNDTHNDVENWTVNLDNLKCTPSGARYSNDNKLMVGFYWKNTNTDPNPAFDFFSMQEGTGYEHFTLWLDDNTVELMNSSGAEIDSHDVSADTWYLVEVLLTIGNPGNLTIHFNGEEWFNITDGAFDGNGASDSTQVEFEGQPQDPLPASSSYTRLGSYYYYKNASSTDDFLGDFEVLTYQNRNDSAIPDAGTTLDVGTWKDVGQTPYNNTDYAQYTGSNEEGHVSSWTDFDGEIPGPYGDSRIDGDGNITAGNWVYRLKGSFLYTSKICYGDVDYDSITTDSSTCVTASNFGSEKTYTKFSDNTNLVANTTQYVQYGFGAQALGATGTKLYEAWGSILHVPEVIAEDSCIPTTNQNWIRNCADTCDILTVNYDMNEFNISFEGSGTVRIDSNLTNITKIIKDDNCEVIWSNGGGFEIK